MTRKTLLLSIHHEYAEAILNGTKTYELRRICPKVGPGDRVLLYVTAPVSAIYGYFEIDEILTGPPTHLWKLIKGSANLTRQQIHTYLHGASAPCAIKTGQVERLSTPINIGSIRRHWADFHPPQSYRYVSANTAKCLGLSGLLT